MGLWKRSVKRALIRLRYPHVRIGANADIRFRSQFEGYNAIGENTHFDGYLGKGSYIGAFCRMDRVRIGRFCSIASSVTVAAGTHPLHAASTSPSFHSVLKEQNGLSYVMRNTFEPFADFEEYGVVIGHDVWIGVGAIILQGVNIGNGAVIGAGAVVTKDVGPYCIVAGVPATSIGKRFDDETVEALLRIGWWDKPDTWLKKYGDAFCDAGDFIRRISKEESDKATGN